MSEVAAIWHRTILIVRNGTSSFFEEGFVGTSRFGRVGVKVEA
jgi:hypothetical protein